MQAITDVSKMLLTLRKHTPQVRAGVCAFLITSLLAGCSTGTGEHTKAAVTSPGDVDTSKEFFIVDCLLPGQVRKLGGNFTYITNRRPIKTATSDCEIRGGEYVSYDRANYSTALKIWLPLAEQGDPVSQTYVGEIYEKGLGLAPDFEVAAHWYRKAAEQDYSRAQINLGHLFEKGLGVKQDQQQALNLYRLASGISGDSLLFASTLSASYVPREEFDVVQSELKQEHKQKAQLQQKLATISQTLKSRSSDLAAAEKQLENTEQALIQLTSNQADTLPGTVTLAVSEEASEKEIGLKVEIDQLHTDRLKLERQLAQAIAQNQELGRNEELLSNRLSRNESVKTEYEQQMLQLEQLLASAKKRLEQSESDLVAVKQRLSKEAADNKASGELMTPALKALQQELEKKNIALISEREQVATLESENGVQLQQLQAALRDLSEKQLQLASENKDYESRLSSLTATLSAREEQLARTNERLQLAQGAFSELTAGQQKLSEKEANLVNRISQMESERNNLEQQLAQFDQQNKQLGNSQRSLTEQLSQAESAKTDHQLQLRKIQQQLLASKQHLTESEQELSAVKQRLQKERDSSANLTPALLALQDELSDKARALTAERNSYKDLEAKSGVQQQELQTAIAALEQKQKKLYAENRGQKQELARMNSLLAEREEKLSTMDQQLLLSKAALQLERANREQALSELSEKHDEAMSEQQQKLAQLTSRYQQQLELVGSQKQQIKDLEQNAKQFQSELNSSAATETPMLVASNDYPGIEIIEPPVVLTRSQSSVRLHSLQGDRQVIGKVMAPAGLMSLSVNGKPQELTENNLFRTTVSLMGGPTPVDVVVVDSKGRRAAVSFSFVRQDKKSQNPQQLVGTLKQYDASGANISMGDYYALIIGNNNYQHFSTLGTAVNDARDTEQVLRNKYNFKTRLLLNADRYTILSALNDLRQNLSAEDNLLIYYAGHGKLDESNNRGYWLPVDAEPENSSNWISNTAITDILNVTEAKHILVVADSCYSGTLTQTPLARVETDIPPDVREEWIKVMAETRARITLTSGGVEPVIDGGGGRHSVFAKAFIDTLRTNNGILEGYSLYSEVLNRMATGSASSEQVPRYAPIHLAGHESGEFFFKPL